MCHNKYAVPILRRGILDIELAPEIVDFGWSVVLVDFEGFTEVLERLVETHKLVQLPPLIEKLDDFSFFLAYHDSILTAQVRRDTSF